MKISEMTNDQAAEAMLRLSGPFGNICEDEEALALLDKIKDEDKKTPTIKMVGKYLPQFVALGLKKHAGDLYEIVGALLAVPTGKVGGMNFAETVKAVRDSWDDMLTSFFTQSAFAARKNGKKSA